MSEATCEQVDRGYTADQGRGAVAPLAGVAASDVHGFLVIVQAKDGRITSGSNLDGLAAQLKLAGLFTRIHEDCPPG